IKVKNINNYLDHTNISDTFVITKDLAIIYDFASGAASGTVTLSETDETFTLDIESSLDWTAVSGVTISPQSGEANKITTMTVTVPLSTTQASIRFTYEGNTVEITIIREIKVTVTATATNGGSVTINGLPSPQQIVTGRNAAFYTTGDTQFLSWTINGEVFHTELVNKVITENTTVVASFLSDKQVMLYCYDEHTTIAGEIKTGDYWILNVDKSYTFSNSQDDFSGFLFGADTEYTSTGSRVIQREDTLLTVYYGGVLMNLTVINESDTHEFSGDSIYLDEDSFDFSVEPGETLKTTFSGEAGYNITFDKLPYHYPIFSTDSFPEEGVYDVTITGYPVGWIGDQEITADTGYQTITQTVYGPIDYTLTGNVPISPNSGNSDQDIEIELLATGGTVTQNIGDCKYILTINQEVQGTKDIAWENDAVTATNDIVTNTFNCPVIYNWHIVTDLSGTEISPASGAGTQPITFTLPANTTGSSRTLTATAYVNGVAYSFTITQAATTIGWMRSSVNTVNNEASNIFKCPSGTIFSITTNLSGVVATPSAGSGTTTINFYLPDNDTGSSRTIIATATVNGMAYTFNIVQAITIYINATPDFNVTTFIDCKGQATYTVTANTPWVVQQPSIKGANAPSANPENQICVFSDNMTMCPLNSSVANGYNYYYYPSDGNYQNKTFSFIFDGTNANGGPAPARGLNHVYIAVQDYVNFEQTSPIYQRIQSIQYNACPQISIDPESVIVGTDLQQYTIQVYANCAWTIDIPFEYETYIYASPLSGDGSGIVHVSVSPNVSGEARTGLVYFDTITGENDMQVTHTVLQEAGGKQNI
ncbi:MAG: hypothetical protein LUE93_04740, partial [Bacteroides sp.]|nr:hypothetical protein [Bacteroides sp.]